MSPTASGKVEPTPNPTSPIAVFDSGVGGLTVLRALLQRLPSERFVYLGDTARVPYGSKPLEMVRGFAAQISSDLVGRGVKAVVIACNTASAASLPALAARLPVPTWGVIRPGVDAALDAVREGGSRRVAVLGTEATIAAGAYQRALEAAGAATWSRACPLFVPIVEEGISDTTIAELVAEYYLADMPEVDAVILGCTHYPLLKPTLRRVLGDEMVLIDSSEAVATTVASELTDLNLLNRGARLADAERLEYLVTGDVDAFMSTARKLGGADAPAARIDLNGHAGTGASSTRYAAALTGLLAS